MMLRVQRERMNAAYFPTEREYAIGATGSTTGAAATCWPTTPIVMHPGPMNRGLEISADGRRLRALDVVEQVANGVAVRMAVLYLLAGAASARLASERDRAMRP